MMSTQPMPQERQHGQVRFGLRAKTLGGLAVLLGMLLLTIAGIVVDSWIALRQARQAEARNSLAGDLARVALDVAVERRVANGALTSTDPAQQELVAIIKERRAASRDPFQSVLDRIAAQPELVRSDLRSDLLAAAGEVDRLRLDVDAELALPLTERSPRVAAAWLPAISGLLETFRQVIGEQSSPEVTLDAELQTVIEARMAAFDLRNAAGEGAALISGLLGSGIAFGLSDAVQIGSRGEATELHWRRLQRLAASIRNPRLARGIEVADRGYFASYVDLLRGIVDAGRAGAPYPVDLHDFTVATSAALGSLDELVLLAHAMSAEMLHARARSAEIRLSASLAAALAGLGVAWFTVLGFSRRVLRPIERVTEAMRRLAVGRSVAADLPVDQPDEVGEMSRAIAAFRDTIIANEAALAEAELFAHQTIDTLPIQVAVLDENGVLIATNKAWRRFCVENDGPADGFIGQSYLAVCEAAARGGDEIAAAIAAGIRSVTAEPGREFETEYPCHSPTRRRWFRMRVARFTAPGPLRLVVSHDDITKRKLAEESLQEKNRLLELAEEMSRTGHWHLDVGRGELSWSSEIYRIHGRDPADHAPDRESMLAAYHPDDRALFAKAIDDAIGSGAGFSLDLRLFRTDGQLRNVEVLADCEKDGEGQIVSLFGVFRDITDRKKVEDSLADINVELERRVQEQTAELSARESYLRAIFDHAPVTISLRDLDGRYVMVNRRFQELLGMAEEDVVGRTPRQFYPERFVGDISQAIDTVRRTKSVVVQEEGAPTVYGDRRYLTTRFPVVDDAGRLSGIGSISVDVTEQRAAEAALRESEARLRAIYESEPECVALLSKDGAILEMNPAGLAMVEAPRAADALGRRLQDLIGPDDRAAFGTLVERVFAGGSGSLLFQLTGFKGSRRWMETNAVPLRDSAGAITAMLAITRDVTGQRSMEEQLRQAQKMEAIGQLTGGVAHDFNNLLGVIVGNLDLLSLKLARHSTERELVDRAVAAAERGAALTQRLLAFARRQTLLPQQVNAGELVTEVAQLLRRAIGEQIELRIQVDPGLRSCYVDPGQLETALVNLAINARDAMPSGGTITITAVNAVADTRRGDGDFVVITVADTGQGMSEEVKARAFEPFYTTKEVGKGSGLGLSMVYGFVEQSGGHVELESEPGKGTTVRLYLRASAGGPVAAVAAPTARGTSRGDGQLVLVVEDDDEMRAFAIDALHRLGYRTVSAVDAVDALSALDEHGDVAAVFTDVVLSGSMDGFSLATRIKTKRPALPVLYTSGFADSDRLPPELPTEEVDLLPKPYRIAELGRRLERLLKREGA